MYKTLTTSVAAIALMTGATFAQSESDAEGTLTTEQSAEMENQATSEELEQSAEQTGDAIEDAAEDTAQAAEDTAEDAAQATEDAAEDTAQAVENTAEDAEQAAENTAEDAENAAEGVAESTEDTAEDMTDGDMAADTEMNAESGNDVTSTAGGMSSTFDGMLVGDILGQSVTTQAGEDVGEIDYVVRQGESLAAVIGIGGFLGLGEYTVAVPLEEFSMAPEGEGMMLSSWTEEELKAQPEFDETGVEGLEDDVPLENAM